MTLALAVDHPRIRALELVRRFGRCTVAFQGLDSEFRYWFDGDDTVVAFVDTGGAWVAAGGPVSPSYRLGEVARRFVETAAAQGRRACFFAAEQALVDCGLPALQIGEQPVWEVTQWESTLAQTSSLRYQLRRARHKGVSVRRVSPSELAMGTTLREAIDALGRHWLATHRMAPMQFLVHLEPLSLVSERSLYIAERDGALIGLASVVPVFARERVFLEDLLRMPSAPNGTTELLFDAVIRSVQTPEVTLGLAPLAGNIATWLRFARWIGGAMYDFEGLRAFKAKLRPRAWEPVYLCCGPGGSKLAALRDSLRAFAGGSLVAFAGRTLGRWR